MNYLKFFCIGVVLFLSAGCKSLDCKPNSGSTLPGTDKGLVGIYIDKDGYPQASVDTIKVLPGDKIVFVGPEKFEIFFKDQRSPIERFEAQSSDGIIIIEIPKDIFERDQRTSNSKEIKKELQYRYGIRANGKVTDPNIVIGRT